MFFNPPCDALVFHCPGSNMQQFSWHHRRADGSVVSGDAHTALPRPLPRQRILLLPADRVMFHQAASAGLPPAALSWQFESLALSEPETLFAIELTRAPECWLAAIDRQWLAQAIAVLSDRGVALTQALPDVLAVPPDTPVRAGDRWLLRTGDWQGISLSEQALSSLQTHSPELQQRSSGEPCGIEALIEGALHCPVNFLQREFSPPVARRPAGGFLLACVLGSALLLLGPAFVSGWQANTQAQALQQQSLTLYQRYFPDTAPASPAAAFQQQYQQLKKDTAPRGPLTLLTASAEAIATLQDNPLLALKWDETRQQLQLTFTHTLPPALSAPGVSIVTEGNQMIISRDS